MAENEVRQQLLISYGNSLLIFYGTPLVVANYWDEEDIKKIEKDLFVKAMNIPRDVKRDVVTNIL
jgi:hypothetical protein